MIFIGAMVRILLFLFTSTQREIAGDANVATKIFYGFLNCMAWIIEKICEQFTK